MKQSKNSLEELFYEESLSGVKIHQSEQENLDRVFEILHELENEPSSDEDKLSKKYLRNIKEKVELKRVINSHTFAVTTKSKMNSPSRKGTTQSPSTKQKKEYNEDNNDFEEKLKSRKFGQKAIRKILRKYLPQKHEMPKEDIRLMIWENDENLDGYLNKIEFDKMYKRCVIDEKEQEPKRLFYLALFLMFDKDKKKYIIEEDTLEILYIRYKEKFEEVLISIFGDAKKGDLPNPTDSKTKMRKNLTYLEFIERMNLLSLDKRKDITKMKKEYCNYIHVILEKEGKKVVHVPKKGLKK